MKLKSLPLWSALALSLVAAACEKSSPAAPSDVGGASAAPATVTDASTGVSVGAPQPVSPAEDAQFRNVEQPVRLVISNGVTTGSTALSYTFEVATDPGFGSIVYKRESVAEGTNQTTITLDRLGPDRKYYWRARSNPGGSTVGPNSRSRSFIVGPEVILQTPVPALPAANETVVSSRPTFTVTNASRIGPAGTIFYEFQLATSSSFSALVASATVQEQPNQTSWSLVADLPGGNYFWRVQASDPSNEVTSGFTSGRPFTLEPFDMRRAVIWNNPSNLGSWEETSKITRVDTSGSYVIVDFDKRQGPGRWPETPFGDGGPGMTQYTLGLCLKISGVWHCSAVIQFWEGRELEAGGHPDLIGVDFYYDLRWGAMRGYQPRPGELVGVFTANGNIRDSKHWAREQRTNVQLIPWRTSWSLAGR